MPPSGVILPNIWQISQRDLSNSKTRYVCYFLENFSTLDPHPLKIYEINSSLSRHSFLFYFSIINTLPTMQKITIKNYLRGEHQKLISPFNYCSTDRRRRSLRESIELIRMIHPPTILMTTQTAATMKLKTTGNERNRKRTRFVKLFPYSSLHSSYKL